MINTLSKINLSKIGWKGGRSTSIWIMSLNILGFFFEITPKSYKYYLNLLFKFPNLSVVFWATLTLNPESTSDLNISVI